MVRFRWLALLLVALLVSDGLGGGGWLNDGVGAGDDADYYFEFHRYAVDAGGPHGGERGGRGAGDAGSGDGVGGDRRPGGGDGYGRGFGRYGD